MGLKVVLAYSGGLDTSVIVPWLREEYDAEVICMAADVGQPGGLGGLGERAKAPGEARGAPKRGHLVSMRSSCALRADVIDFGG